MNNEKEGEESLPLAGAWTNRRIRNHKWTDSVSVVLAILITAAVATLASVTTASLRSRSRGEDLFGKDAGDIATTIPCPRTVDNTTQWRSFFLIGDWGRKGNRDQARVATLMSAVAAGCHRELEFVISAGDNFYQHGLLGYDDPLFTDAFSKPYASLRVPWYSVLGNHDYGDEDPLHPELFDGIGGKRGATWQITADEATDTPLPGDTLSARDPRWNCRRGSWRLRVVGTAMDVVFVETYPLLFSPPPGSAGERRQEAVLNSTRSLLASSDAAFKLVVGHHPIRTVGNHCGCSVTRPEGECRSLAGLERVLSDQGADAYLCGHQHNLQIVRSPPAPSRKALPLPTYIVSGAGSEVSRKMKKDPRCASRLMSDDLRGGNASVWETPGFISVTVTNDSVCLDFWDVTGYMNGPIHREIIPLFRNTDP